MTEVTVVKTDRLFLSLEAEGHSCFAKAGRDLVCAAISSILTGLANAINLVEGDCNIRLHPSHFSVKNSSKNEVISHYLQCVVTQLQTLEEAYPNNVRVKILERRPYEV